MLKSFEKAFSTVGGEVKWFLKIFFIGYVCHIPYFPYALYPFLLLITLWISHFPIDHIPL